MLRFSINWSVGCRMVLSWTRLDPPASGLDTNHMQRVRGGMQFTLLTVVGCFMRPRMWINRAADFQFLTFNKGILSYKWVVIIISIICFVVTSQVVSLLVVSRGNEGVDRVLLLNWRWSLLPLNLPFIEVFNLQNYLTIQSMFFRITKIYQWLKNISYSLYELLRI